MHTLRSLISVCLIVSLASSGLAATAVELIPAAAPHGGRVIVRGTDLQRDDLSLTFPDGASGTNATIHERAAKYAEATVPVNAISGGVRVATGIDQIATLPFTVLPDAAFESVKTLAASDQAHDLLKSPGGIAIDPSSGTVYVADTRHHQIKAITGTSVVILAGSGQPGFTDGTGAIAQFKEPVSIAFDAARKLLYVADRLNHVIRRVSLTGAVTTLAGSGNPGDRDGVGTTAAFNQPAGLAVDASGNIFVTDTANNRIKRVTPIGGVTTIAGTGRGGFADGVVLDARFAEPEGIAVDASGTLYVADTKNHRIRRIAGGAVTTVAGSGSRGFSDGVPAQARFDEPRGLALDEAGNLLIADSGNDVIRKFVAAGVTTIAGRVSGNQGRNDLIDGPALQSQFDDPRAIAVAGALFVADAGHDAVRMVVPALQLSDLYPRRGPLAGGNQVRIFGVGFVPGRTTATVGGITATTVVVTSTEILVTMPARPAGPAVIAITTPAGSATLTGPYTYLAPPTLVSIAPAKGKTAGGQSATVRGTEFAAGETEVLFGGVPATAVTVDNPTSATVTTPPGTQGPVDVLARTSIGEARLDGGFKYFDPPVITSINPLQSRVGDAVTITGQNFDSELNGNTAAIGPFALPILFASAAQLVVTIPQNAVTGRITVNTSGGSAVSATNAVILTYTSISVAPATTSLNVGGTVRLTASGVLPNGMKESLAADVTWTSGDTFVASVASDGTARGVSAGATNVTATYRGLSASSVISVTPSIPLPPEPALVAPSLDRTVPTALLEATSFIYSGLNPIQRDVLPETIDGDRVALLRGRLKSSTGAPLSGVQVTINDRPEYGSTLSRLDGMFDLVVNGGGTLTVHYVKNGYLPVDRLFELEWQERRVLDDVVMTPLDPAITVINGGASVSQVARGSVTSDERGTRRATMIFNPGTTASMMLPDGSTTPLPTMSIRATEYSVGPNGPQAMPAELPANSGYTYCVELGADEAVAAGATSVAFNQPVSVYVENFLGLPVGTFVPAGFYDRIKGLWVTAENGRVMRTIDVSGGRANVDADGNGSADNAGLSDGERVQLATLYAAGQSYWRVSTMHFSPHDYNFSYGPTPGALLPPAAPPTAAEWIRGGRRVCGWSTIDCENQTLIESIPIDGTPYSLDYDSGRASRSQYQMTVPVSGATLNPNVTGLDLRISIEGREFHWTYSPETNVEQEFEWDGKDAYGRKVQGAASARVTVQHLYPLAYYPTSLNRNAFGLPPADARPFLVLNTRQVPTQRTYTVTLGRMDMKPTGFGGWSFSAQNHYDPTGQAIYLPNGELRIGDPGRTGAFAVNVIAGNGQCCGTGDGGSATDAKLNYPTSVAVAPDGSYFIAESSRIRRVGREGIITTIAGTGVRGFSGDGGPATAAQVDVWDLTIGPDETIYFTNGGSRIRHIDRNGMIDTVAGNGAFGDTGDGGPATAASIRAEGVTVAIDGNIYIAARNKIRRVSPAGIITTTAGRTSGQDGSTAENILATDAYVETSLGVSIGPDGSIYFSEVGLGLVRRITPDGIIRTIAGSRTATEAVLDGQEATSGRLTTPWGIAVAPDGSVIIAEGERSVIRAVGADGIVRTIAGGAPRNFTLPANGSLGRSIYVDYPYDLDIGPDGNIYFIDFTNTVRRAQQPFPVKYSQPEAVIASTDGSSALVFNRGRHVRTVDRLTATTLETFGYDAQGRLVSITDLDGDVTTIERRADGEATAILAPGSQRTTVSTSAAGTLDALTRASGSYRFTYQDGLLQTLTDPRTGLHRFRYDVAGRLIRDEDPVGGFLSFTTNSNDRSTTISRTSAEGRTTTFHTDVVPTQDHTRTITSPDGTASTILQTGDGKTTTTSTDGVTSTTTEIADPGFGMQSPLVGSSTVRLPSGLTFSGTRSRKTTLAMPGNPLSLMRREDTSTINGRVWTSIYDAATRTMTLRSPTGRQRVATFDVKGRVGRLDIPGLASQFLTFDTHGRLASVERGSRTYTLTYNERHELSRVTDPLSRATTFARDAADRVTSQTLPDGRIMTFSYDDAGNLTAIAPPGRPAHTFTFTAIDQVGSYTAPGSARTLYSYNKDRQLVLITRPDGVTIAPAYDSAGRLVSLSDLNGAFTYHYSSSGQVASVVAPGGETLVYTYDGPLTTAVTWVGEVAGSVAHAYDASFRVVNENGVDYSYDDDDLLLTAGSLSLHRDPNNGLLTSSTLGALEDSMSYNEFGEMTSYAASFGSAALLASSYTRDEAGRITASTETIMGSDATTTGYEYDTAGRLARVTRAAAPVAEYDYDANGNRTAHRFPGGSNTATTDDQDRLLTNGSTAYGYTANGELETAALGASTTTYDYDAFGSLRAVLLPGGARIDYVNDGQHRRVGKKINGALSRAWLYGDQLRIVAELDGSSNVVSRFVYGTRSNIPDSMIKGGITYRIVSDHLGSPRLVVNVANGTIAQSMTFDEFGNVISDTNPGFQPFGFAGGLYDRDTGLVRFGARDYDPHTGRWTAKDPIRFEGRQANLYGYSFNDPINYFDPNGLANVVVGAGGSLVSVIGPEASTGVAVNVDVDGPQPTADRIGVFGTGGGGEGVNASWDVFIGFIRGPLSNVGGNTINVNFGFGPASGTVIFSESCEWQGATIGAGNGLPFGLSVTVDHTTVRTVRQLGGSPTNLRTTIPSSSIQ